jgi:hypothetical protein
METAGEKTRYYNFLLLETSANNMVFLVRPTVMKIQIGNVD